MSKVADFYAKAMGNEDAKAKIAKVIGGKGVEELTDDQLKEIGEIAKGLGFDITLEEAKAYLKSVEEELSDKALDAVAGGGATGDGINCKSGGGYAA